MKNWQSRFAQIKQIFFRVVHRFNQDNCFSTASALSFTTLLALVPLVTVIFSMLSIFPVFGEWSGAVENFLFENFVPTAGEAVKSYLLDFSSKAGKLTAFGLVFLLISSLLLLSTIEDAFNKIWKVPKGRNWFQRLIVYWSVLTLGPLLIAISLSMSSALLSMSIFAEQSVIASFTESLLRFMPLVFELLAFLLFYQAIPNIDTRMKYSFYGAIVATILFELSKVGFGYYILNFNSYQRIYGALATIPIFFVWIYLCWLVLLAGALVSAVSREIKEVEA